MSGASSRCHSAWQSSRREWASAARRSICVDGWRCARCQGQHAVGTRQRPNMCGTGGSKDGYWGRKVPLSRRQWLIKHSHYLPGVTKRFHGAQNSPAAQNNNNNDSDNMRWRGGEITAQLDDYESHFELFSGQAVRPKSVLFFLVLLLAERQFVHKLVTGKPEGDFYPLKRSVTYK